MFAGHFIDFNIMECDSFRRFSNKIWQACRYIEGVVGESEILLPVKFEEKHLLSAMDCWILSKLSFLILELSKSLNSLHLNQCVQGLRDFVHHDFCDVYLVSLLISFLNLFCLLNKIILNGFYHYYFRKPPSHYGVEMTLRRKTLLGAF